MRVVVVGGSGHIGTFLVPRLVRAGHEVVNLSRGRRASYRPDDAWQEVRQVYADRAAEDASGSFAGRVAALAPDAVVDLICFTPASAAALVDALRGRTGQLLVCGSIWRHGPSRKLPITETNATEPVGEYGVAKAAIARLLADETAGGGLVTTSIHPGHIVGAGWTPIGPLGNADPAVWRALSSGEPLAVPGLGAELLHHVHADDVAQAFELALTGRDRAAGEDFNVVAPSALTVRGYAEIAASWFGQAAELRTVTWQEFARTTAAEHYETSWEHLHRSQYVSTDKARTVLGFAPRYEPEEAILESVRWLIEHGQLDVATPITLR